MVWGRRISEEGGRFSFNLLYLPACSDAWASRCIRGGWGYNT